MTKPVLHPSEKGILEISAEKSVNAFAPIETVTLSSSQAGRLTVTDGAGNEVLACNVVAESRTAYTVGGALGVQIAVLRDDAGDVLDRLRFKVDTQTTLQDSDDEFGKLFRVLEFGLYRQFGLANV